MIAVIEQAIKQRLKEAGLAYLKGIATYRADFDAGLAQAVRNTPAIWVTFRGAGKGKALSTTRETWAIPVSYGVIMCARRIHNEEAARHGVVTARGVAVGTYQMLADVQAVLLQNDLGLGGIVDHLCPGRIAVMANGLVGSEKVSMLMQEWHTTYLLQERRPGLAHHIDADMRGPDAPSIPPEGPKPGEPNRDGTTLPPLPEIPWLDRVGMDYWLQPQDPAQNEPDSQDMLTL